MIQLSYNRFTLIVFSLFILVSVSLTNCKKEENPIKFPLGTFPDSLVNLTNINSPFDDYNLTLYQLLDETPILFSSNRKSSGGQFDLEQGSIVFTFDQTNGSFNMEASMTNNSFYEKLINQAKTPGNDFGPYTFFSALDGYEYLLLSSVTNDGDLDLFYLKNRPVFGSSLPDIIGPNPIKLLNTSSDDAYICFDSNYDSAYFVSDREGVFNIYQETKPLEEKFDSWFDLDYSASIKVDSINSSSDDKCPAIYNNIMIFSSNRPGGLGGFDLYYSIFKNGNWNSPINFGPDYNTSSDEYRPVIGFKPKYTNNFLIFSSNRPGGKGGFDLYFTGIESSE
jgi:WD40 repeat protein